MLKPLTSLRFFFAFSVFTYHTFFFSYEGPTLLGKIKEFVFAEGYIGVSFFFVLSGFILAFNYNSKIATKKCSNVEFWIARLARIYPLHIFTTLIAIIISHEELYTNPLKWLAYLTTHLTLTQSFIPINEFNVSLNSVAWSIANEAFFYLCFPLLATSIVLKKKAFYSTFFLGIIMVPILSHLLPNPIRHWAIYFFPLTRLVDFMIGLVLFDIYCLFSNKISKKSADFLEILSIIILFSFFMLHNFIPDIYRSSSYYWIPMSLLILAFSFQKGFLSQILSIKPLIVLGEISFAFYLVHLLVIRVYMTFLNDNFNNYIDLILTFSISLFLSFVLHKFIELPMNRLIKAMYNKNKVISFEDSSTSETEYRKTAS